MFQALQVVTVALVATAMALPLAHALELPGKMRLRKEEYLAVQPIYYPGFTVGGGVGEVGGLLATLLLAFVTPPGTPAFWLTLGAFVSLLAAHVAYWILTHPVNNFWLANFELRGLGKSFFRSAPFAGRRPGAQSETPDWTVLRDRWERSHVVRAVLALISLLLLATAVAA